MATPTFPRERLDNPSLRNWFNETDAWWFDNVRFNAERLDNQYKRAIALTLGMMVGDYVISFTAENSHLREPLSLSRVFRQFAETIPFHYDSALHSKATNQDTRAFVAERRHTDLLFLRLPTPMQPQTTPQQAFAWREEWLQGGDDFGATLKRTAPASSVHVCRASSSILAWWRTCFTPLRTCPDGRLHIPENGFISTDEMVETIGRVRKIDAVYSKDFRIYLVCVRRSLRRRVSNNESVSNPSYRQKMFGLGGIVFNILS